MNLNLINNWPYKWFGFWKHEGSNNSIKCDHLPSINEFIDSTWQPEYKQEIIKYLS